MLYPLALSDNRLYNLLMSQPFKLYRLQKIDLLIDQARTRFGEIEKILSNNEPVLQATSRVEQAETALKEARKDLKREEDQVREQQIKIELTESALYGGRVHNPKELQDLENEAAALKRFLTVLEDRQLEKMLAVEEAEVSLGAASTRLTNIQSQVASQNSVLVSENDHLLEDLKRLENERSTITSTIDVADLNIYEQLRLQRRGVAVSEVTDNTCSACGSTLTPGQVQASHSPSQIIRCTFCGRILYAG